MDIYPKEVVFNPPYEEVNTSTLKLTNTTNHTLIYKVKTTSPTLYCVRPNASAIEAGHSKDIEITRQGKSVSHGEQSKDKFLILSAAVNATKLQSQESVAEIWTELEKDRSSSNFEAQKLKVVYKDNGAGHQYNASQGGAAAAGAPATGTTTHQSNYSSASGPGAPPGTGAGIAGAGIVGATGNAGITPHNNLGSSRGLADGTQTSSHGFDPKAQASEYGSRANEFDPKSQTGEYGSHAHEYAPKSPVAGQEFSSPASKNYGTPLKGGDYSARQDYTPSHENYSGKDYAGTDYAGKDYAGKDYSGKDYAGKDYSGKDYAGLAGQGYAGQDHHAQGYAGQGQGYTGQGQPGQEYQGQDYASQSQTGHHSGHHSGKEHSSKDYSSKSPSKDYAAENQYTKENGQPGSPDSNLAVRSKTGSGSDAASEISKVSGSGPDGKLTVDDIQGTPGLPPKSKLVDEGNAKTGPKLANSNLPDGPKPETVTDAELKKIHSKDHKATGSDSGSGSGSGSKSVAHDGVASDHASQTTGSSYKDSDGNDLTSSIKNTGSEYAASAKDTANQYAHSVSAAAGTAAGIAAGAAAGAASQVSNWISGSKNGEQSSADRSTDAGAERSAGRSADNYSSTTPQKPYAGGFENIVNGGGFEARPATSAAEKEIAGGPKSASGAYGSTGASSGNYAPTAGTGSTSGYDATNSHSGSNYGSSDKYGSSNDSKSYGTRDGSSSGYPQANNLSSGSHSGSQNLGKSSTGGYDSFSPSDNVGNASYNKSSSAGHGAAGAGAVGAGGAGIGALATEAAQHAKGTDINQFKDYVPESQKANFEKANTYKGQFDSASQQVPPELKNKLSGIGGSGSHSSHGQGYTSGTGATGSSPSGAYGSSGSNYDSAATNLKGSNLGSPQYSSGGQYSKGDSYSHSHGPKDTHDNYSTKTSGYDSHSSPSGTGHDSSYSSRSPTGSSAGVAGGLGSDRGSTSKDSASGFEATVNGTASSAGGAYSNNEVTSQTLARDPKSSADPQVGVQHNDVPLNVTVLLVIIAFLIGWKFF